MRRTNPEAGPGAARASTSVFDTTHWSVVLAAGRDASPQTDKALEVLCRTYWNALYAFVRGRGYAVHDAQDLTQAFFLRLLDKHYLNAVDRTKGRFRSFLLAAMEHFLANQWRDAHTQKRGGRVAFISLNDASAEQQYLQVVATGLSPEKLFDRQWAMALLEQVLGELRDECAKAGKGPLFEELRIFLTGEKAAASYTELAMKLATTEAALKMAVSRLRRRYGELLRVAVAKTVAAPQDVQEELRSLFAALS